MYAFLTIWDGGGHWLVIVGVAIGNSPHGVASIIMGTDKQVSRAFPHQALQLLQGGTHTHKHTHRVNTEPSEQHKTILKSYLLYQHEIFIMEHAGAPMCTKLCSVNQVPACPGRAARHGGCSDPIGSPGPGCSQSESSLTAGDAPEETPPAPKISHICNHLAG